MKSNIILYFFIVIAFILLLSSCSSAPPTAATSQLRLTSDLAFSKRFVEQLSKAGITVLSVQSSTYMSMFQSSDKAVWIKTDQGVMEAVFFAQPAEVKEIQVTQLPSGTNGRYLYKIHAPAPTLSHDVTIDAAFPQYFIALDHMFIVTYSEELDKTVKQILSEP